MVKAVTSANHETFKLMIKIAHGGMVTTAATAEAIAAAILKDHHGDEELALQQPFKTTDEGDSWAVEGSHEEPGWGPGGRSWGIRIMKDDGQVVKAGHRMPPIDPPEYVKTLIEQERIRRRAIREQS